METQKLPFETNPQIERYLKDILYLHDEWLENEKAIYLIKEVLEKYEEMSPEENRNTAVFWIAILVFYFHLFLPA